MQCREPALGLSRMRFVNGGGAEAESLLKLNRPVVGALSGRCSKSRCEKE